LTGPGGRPVGAEEQRSRGAEEQRSRGAEEQRGRGAEEQRSRGAEEQRSRGAEEQRSRGAEEQRSRGAYTLAQVIMNRKTAQILRPARFSFAPLQGAQRYNFLINKTIRKIQF
jgi:hypothetical protein